jgi:hypothetical protein
MHGHGILQMWYVTVAHIIADNVLPLLGEARIHDALNNSEASLALYKQVLHIEASNVEAMACMAAHQFYTDQPEVALRFYRYIILVHCTPTPYAI